MSKIILSNSGLLKLVKHLESKSPGISKFLTVKNNRIMISDNIALVGEVILEDAVPPPINLPQGQNLTAQNALPTSPVTPSITQADVVKKRQAEMNRKKELEKFKKEELPKMLPDLLADPGMLKNDQLKSALGKIVDKYNLEKPQEENPLTDKTMPPSAVPIAPQEKMLTTSKPEKPSLKPNKGEAKKFLGKLGASVKAAGISIQ